MGGMILPVKEVGWAMIAIVFVLVAFSLSTVWLGGMQNYTVNQTPTGPLFYEPEDIEAIQSVQALVCAINSVDQGSEYHSEECNGFWDENSDGEEYPYYSPPTREGIFEPSGFSIGMGGRAKTLCKRGSDYYYYCSDMCQMGDAFIKAYDSEEECSDARRLKTIKDYQEGEMGAKVDCAFEDGRYVCRVEDFHLSQDVSDYEKWIPYHGDPFYLLYWQNFPEEEDTWNYQVSSTTYIVIGALSIAPWGKIFSPIGSKILTPSLNFVKNRLGLEAAERIVRNAVTRFKFWYYGRNIVSVGKTGAIKRFMNRALGKITQRRAGVLATSKHIVKKRDEYVRFKSFITDLSSEQVERAFRKTESEMAEMAIIGNTEAYLRKYSESLVDNIFIEGSEQTTPSLTGLEAVKKEMIRDINENLLEITTKDALKQSWASRIIAKDNLEKLPTYAMRASGAVALTGMARALEIADSIISARDDVFPNTISLKKPLADAYSFPLSDSMSGKPVFVNLKNVKDYLVLPELFDDQKPFYLVSPCHLDSMEVSSIKVVCGNYDYEDVIRLDPETGSLTSLEVVETCNGEINKVSDSSEGESCDIDTYSADTTWFSEVDKEFIEWVQGLEETPGQMGLVYNETPLNFTIPVARDMYVHYIPGSEIEEFIPPYSDKEGSWSLTEIDKQEQSVALSDDKQEALRQLSEALIECFDKLEKGQKGYCTIFNTEDMGTLSIKENDIEDWMKDNMKGSDLERVEDLIGDSGWDNMDWEIKSISAGKPLFVMIYPSYFGVNEVHLDSTENSYILEIKKTGTNGETVLEREVEIKRYGIGTTDIMVRIKGEAEEDTYVPYGGYGLPSTTITEHGIEMIFSDMGDYGILRSISISDGADMLKTMTDTDFAEDGFEKYSLSNCLTDAIIVSEMEKSSKDEYEVNYCTRGETTGQAWLEYAGDVGGVLAVAAACTVGAVSSAGSTCAGAISTIMYVWGIAEVATEMYTKVGGWPTQTWS